MSTKLPDVSAGGSPQPDEPGARGASAAPKPVEEKTEKAAKGITGGGITREGVSPPRAMPAATDHKEVASEEWVSKHKGTLHAPVSKDVLVMLIALTKPLMGGITRETEQDRLRKAVIEIAREDKDWLVQATPHLARANGSERLSLLETLAAMPPPLRKFLREYTEIPQEQKGDVIVRALPLMIGFKFIESSTLHRGCVGMLLSAIAAIPQEQRDDCVSRAANLMGSDSAGIFKVIRITALIKAIAAIPQHQRAEAIALVSKQRQIAADFLHCFSKLPIEIQNKDLIKSALPLLVGIANKDEFETLLKLVDGTLLNKREDFIKDMIKAKPLLEGIVRDDERVTLWKFVVGIPQNEREDMIKAKPLLEGLASANERITLLKAVVGIPKTQREDVIAHAPPLLKNIENASIRERLLNAVAAIPQSERGDCVAKTIPLLVDNPVSTEREKMLNAVKQIPRGQRESFFAQNKSLLVNIRAGVRGQFLEDYVKLTPNRREAVLKICALYPLSQVGELSDPLRKLIKAPENEIDDVLARLKTLLPEISSNAHRVVLLRACSEVNFKRTFFESFAAKPPDQRAFLLEFLALSPRVSGPLVNSIMAWSQQQRALLRGILTATPEAWRRDLMETIAQLSEDQRWDVLTRAAPLLASISSGPERVSLLYVIARVPQNQRGSLLARIHAIAHPQRVMLLAHTSRLSSRLSQDQAEEMLARTIPLLEGVTSGYEILRLLEQVSGISLSAVFADDIKYRLVLSRSKLEKEPVQVLSEISEQFSSYQAHVLNITFAGEAGSDVGGLGRQFIADIFSGIQKVMKFEEQGKNGLYRPVLGMDASGVKPLSDAEKRVYNELGQLMMFCLNATRDYPIGMLFDLGVFTAIIKLKETHLARQPDELFNDVTAFNELFAIYEAMGSSEVDKKSIQDMKKTLEPPSDEWFEFAFDLLESKDVEKLGIKTDEDIKLPKEEHEKARMERLAKIKEKFPQISVALKGAILRNNIRPSLEPIIEIAKGMKSAPFTRNPWSNVRLLTADSLSEKLQGTVSREMILKKLEYINVPQQKKEWIEKWIQKTSDTKLEQFLFAMTGSSALGNRGLTIENNTSTDKLYFHTCFNSVDIPLTAIESESELKSILEGSLAGKEFSKA